MNPAQPTISAADRLGLTLFLAASVHAIIILGVIFKPGDPADLDAPPSLEIILVQTRNDKAPEKADYLAQTAQEGGGESDQRARPSNPFTSTEFTEADGIAPQPVESGNPDKAEQQDLPVITQLYSDHEMQVTEELLESEVRQPDKQNPQDYDLEIARLTAELNLAREAYAKRPKKKVLTASTHEYLPARYMLDWVRKVERIGNLNYPDQAAREHLEGTLILEVELKWDGSIVEVSLIRSSGHKILDDAAKRIVELAAPYPPFPAELREAADHIEIVRTWQFADGDLNTK